MDYGPLGLTTPTIVTVSAIAAVLAIVIGIATYFGNPFGLLGYVLKIVVLIAAPVMVITVALLTVTLWAEGMWSDDAAAISIVLGTLIAWAVVVLECCGIYIEYYRDAWY